MDLAQIEAAVARAFAVTGEATPGWPDPHGGDPEPKAEEYSRCTDPYKYRIVLARAEAWVTALVDLGLATARDVPVTGLWRDEPDRDEPLRDLPDRATVLEPARSGALPLLFACWNGGEGRAASVRVGAGLPAVAVGQSPDCGCDACDFGSDGHLVELDRAVLPVVTGDWLHVKTPEVMLAATADGWEAQGRDLERVDARALLEDARAGRSRHRVVRASRWW